MCIHIYIHTNIYVYICFIFTFIILYIYICLDWDIKVKPLENIYLLKKGSLKIKALFHQYCLKCKFENYVAFKWSLENLHYLSKKLVHTQGARILVLASLVLICLVLSIRV